MRVDDWPLRLNAVIDSARAARFAWGRHDCVTFAAACVHAVTGRDVLPAVARGYANQEAAAQVLATLGGDLRAVLDQLLGPRIAPAQAQRGDLVLLEQAKLGATLAVCCGRQVAGPGACGLTWRPLTDALAAWRVG